MNIVKNYKNIAITSLMACLVLGLHVFFLRKLQDNIHKISTIAAEIQQENNKEASLRMLGKTLSETEEERRVVESIFVPNEGVVLYIEMLERLARGSGVEMKIDSLSLEKLPTETMEEISLRLTAKGGYSSIRKFLSSLHDLKVASEWSRASMSKSVTEAGSSEWTLTVDMKTLKIK